MNANWLFTTRFMPWYILWAVITTHPFQISVSSKYMSKSANDWFSIYLFGLHYLLLLVYMAQLLCMALISTRVNENSKIVFGKLMLLTHLGETRVKASRTKEIEKRKMSHPSLCGTPLYLVENRGLISQPWPRKSAEPRIWALQWKK